MMVGEGCLQVLGGLSATEERDCYSNDTQVFLYASHFFFFLLASIIRVFGEDCHLFVGKLPDSSLSAYVVFFGNSIPEHKYKIILVLQLNYSTVIGNKTPLI